jgi:hypothetical protein
MFSDSGSINMILDSEQVWSLSQNFLNFINIVSPKKYGMKNLFNFHSTSLAGREQTEIYVGECNSQ